METFEDEPTELPQLYRDQAHLKARCASLDLENRVLKHIIKDAMQHPEWCEKFIVPCMAEEFQNWKIEIFLPVPRRENDKSPEKALERHTGNVKKYLIALDKKEKQK